MKRKLASVIFLDGCIVEKDTFFFSSRLDALGEGDYHHGRLSAVRHGQWFYQDREHQVVSVCIRRETAIEPVRASCALERMSGMVGLYLKGEPGPRNEVLPGTKGGFGPMSQLAQINGVLYACGVDGSIYKRQSEGWVKFDDGLSAKTLVDYQAEGNSLSDALHRHMANRNYIQSIGGLDDNIFICGLKGILFHRKKNGWLRMESPTNANLFRIKCIDKNTVYIVGEKGILLKGNARGFQSIPTGVRDDFTCLEWFDNKLYVGGNKGVYVLDGGALHYVDTKQKTDFPCIALDAYDGQLLAVSERWFLVFDSKGWNRIDHPDNEEVLKGKG